MDEQFPFNFRHSLARANKFIRKAREVVPHFVNKPGKREKIRGRKQKGGRHDVQISTADPSRACLRWFKTTGFMGLFSSLAQENHAQAASEGRREEGKYARRTDDVVDMENLLGRPGDVVGVSHDGPPNLVAHLVHGRRRHAGQHRHRQHRRRPPRRRAATHGCYLSCGLWLSRKKRDARGGAACFPLALSPLVFSSGSLALAVQQWESAGSVRASSVSDHQPGRLNKSPRLSSPRPAAIP